MKRLFDLGVTLLAAVAWVPVLLLAGLAVLLLEGAPVLYVSRRRVYRDRTQPVLKFRTMRRDAERIASRATVPIEDTRFLNIPPDSPLYTPVGRVLERFCLTELPQLLHVLRGEMSLVGNRPLPEDVIAALKDAHPDVEQRFASRCGLTGPVQLAGRERVSDAQRLRIEVKYCQVALQSYSMRLDFMILLYTVLMGLRLHLPFSATEVEELLARYERAERRPAGELCAEPIDAPASRQRERVG